MTEYSVTHSLIQSGFIDASLAERGIEDAGDSCGMMPTGQTMTSGRHGAESQLCFLQASGIEQVIYKVLVCFSLTFSNR